MSDISVELLESYLYWYKGKVQRVVDGDSIVVKFDFGRKHFIEDDPIRLLDIDAPEIRGVTLDVRTQGLAAKDAITCYIAGVELEEKDLANKAIDSGNCFVYINTKIDKSDSFKRILGRIYNFKGQDLNQKMLDNGFAITWK